MANIEKYSGHRYTEAQYDSALEAIRASTSPNIKKILGHPLPSYTAIMRRCGLDDAFRAKFHDALANRNSPKRYRADAFVQALDLIRANPNVPVKKLLKAADVRLPSPRQLDWKIERDPSLLSRAAPIRRMRKQAFSHRRKLAVKQPLPKNVLITALRMNHLYAVAERSVPKHLDPFDRDDVKSELILAMLSGEISVEDAAHCGKRFASRFRNQNPFQFSSLDQISPSDRGANLRMVDTLTTDRWEAS